LTKGGLGLVLLINNDHPEPVKQMEFYLESFNDFINDTGVVIGITRSGINDNASLGDYQSKLFERNQVFPVFEVDSRSSDDIKILIHALLAVLEN